MVPQLAQRPEGHGRKQERDARPRRSPRAAPLPPSASGVGLDVVADQRGAMITRTSADGACRRGAQRLLELVIAAGRCAAARCSFSYQPPGLTSVRKSGYGRRLAAQRGRGSLSARISLVSGSTTAISRMRVRGQHDIQQIGSRGPDRAGPRAAASCAGGSASGSPARRPPACSTSARSSVASNCCCMSLPRSTAEIDAHHHRGQQHVTQRQLGLKVHAAQRDGQQQLAGGLAAFQVAVRLRPPRPAGRCGRCAASACPEAIQPSTSPARHSSSSRVSR